MWQVAGGRIIISGEKKKKHFRSRPKLLSRYGIDMARAPYTYRKRNAETWRPQRVVSKALAGYKAQTTSYITLPGTVSGNLFLGLKINKYWKPTKWRAAFPPNRGLTWQAVIFKGPHILIQVSSVDLTSKFVVTFRYGTQEEELGVGWMAALRK